MKHSGFRRILVVGVALAIATVLLRGQIADALVVRGDGELYRGDFRAAQRFYARAARFDALDGVAIDRLCFASMTVRSVAGDLECVEAAGPYLRKHPEDASVRFERAMVYRHDGRAGSAFEDFAIIGFRGDPRALAFAAAEAAKLGKKTLARSMWRRVLAMAPNLPIAIHALAAQR